MGERILSTEVEVLSWKANWNWRTLTEERQQSCGKIDA